MELLMSLSQVQAQLKTVYCSHFRNERRDDFELKTFITIVQT